MSLGPRTPEELVHSLRKLASLSALHMHLLELLLDPGTSLLDMVPLINRDPALTARVLRRSNSAYYGRSGTVGTVLEAIKVLGLGQLREIVLATTVQQMFEHIPRDLLSLPGFWRHSLAVAILGRELALACGYPDADEARTAGLLHDVGRLLMLTVMPVPYHKLLLFARAAGHRMSQVEFEHIGYTHAQAGGALFTEWGFPQALAQVARFHHQPEEIFKHRQLVMIVQLADVLAHALELGQSGETRIPCFHTGIWQELELDFARVKPMLYEVETRLADELDLLLES
jgi:putative nucleotidyltransferase with HDIG domain